MIPSKLYRFSIDTFNGRFVNGWCFHRLYKKRKLRISIVADGQLIGTTETGEFRRDLKKMKLHQTGLCGFDYSFPPGFSPDRYQLLEIYVTGLDKPLFTIDAKKVEFLSPDPAQKICFMHIPKTAGSSFNAFLRRCYPDALYSPHLERLPEEVLEETASSKSCISGHLPWYRIKLLAEDGQQLFYSIIREPYRHLHSHINYVRKVAADSDDQANYEYTHNDTIRDLAEKLVQVNFKDDAETRNFVDNLVGYELDFFDNIQTRYFLDYRPDKVGMLDLQNAQKNIINFKLVGLTEQYSRFVDQFCQELCLPAQAELPRSNISDHYRLFDVMQPATDNPLEPLVAVDQLLYRHVSGTYWEGAGR